MGGRKRAQSGLQRGVGSGGPEYLHLWMLRSLGRSKCIKIGSLHSRGQVSLPRSLERITWSLQIQGLTARLCFPPIRRRNRERGGGCFQSPPMTGSRAGAIGQEVRSRLMRGFSSGGSGHPSVRGLGAGDAAACTGWWSTAQPHTLSATAGSPWRRNHYLPPRGRRLAPRALGTKTMWLCYGV